MTGILLTSNDITLGPTDTENSVRALRHYANRWRRRTLLGAALAAVTLAGGLGYATGVAQGARAAAPSVQNEGVADMMEIQHAETQVRRLKAALEALEAAKTPATAAFKAGLPEIEKALEAQRAFLVEFLEEVAATPWWSPADSARLIGVINISWRLVGLETGGQLLKLIVKLGDKCRPYAEAAEGSKR